jgi:hypothetical protein
MRKIILIQKIPEIVWILQKSAKFQSILTAENPDIQSAQFMQYQSNPRP